MYTRTMEPLYIKDCTVLLLVQSVFDIVIITLPIIFLASTSLLSSPLPHSFVALTVKK